MKYYTGVGSRLNVPAHVIKLMEELACVLAPDYTLRSGSAIGSDQAFERGVLRSAAPSNFVSYLPYDNFKGRISNRTTFKLPATFSNYSVAEEIAASIHPAWAQCSKYSKQYLIRDVYQFLGDDLSTPSEFTILYAKPIGEDELAVHGGTNMVYQLTRKYQTPFLNLYKEEDCAIAQQIITKQV